MTDFRTADGIGARIKALRKLRGIGSARALADLIDHPNVTDAILQNIEAGRKVDLTISQLLNLALALGVPPSVLLAPIGRPQNSLDLSGLSSGFDGMTSAEFDGWMSGMLESAYVWKTAAEHSERAQLEALRTLLECVREKARLGVALGLEATRESGSPFIADTQKRLSTLDQRIDLLASFLESAGWDTTSLITRSS